jgi:uncharacterized protein (DUF885 family)
MTQAPLRAALLDEFFASYYRHRPVGATFIGVHDYDDRLPDYSAQGVADVVAEMEGIRTRLRGLPPEPLSDSEALDQTLVDGFLEIQRWEYASPHFLCENPCVYTGEAVFGVIGLFLRDFAPVAERVESAIARMHAIPGFLAQSTTNVRRAPRAWVERAMRECDGALAFFRDGVAVLTQDLAISDPRVSTAAERAAAAFAEFRSYLQTELIPTAHDSYACGGEAFAMLLRRGHFLEVDAAEIRSMAEAQLAECEAELRTRAREFGAGSWREALAQLADRHPTAARYYARYTEVWDAAREAAIAGSLVTWPYYPIRYVPQPAWARTAAPALYFLAYRSPAPFDRLPIVEYLVPPVDPGAPPDEQRRRLRAANDSVIKLNHVIHHGGLGHHVQNWYAFHAASRVGQVAAVDCASRIAMFCGGTMAEGWACYATDLMDEIGFLSPLEHYAQIHARLRMAARAIVDVRLHHGTMTLEDAATFYETRVGLSTETARAEAVKNTMFPATAMMYMVGTDLIHQLRREIAARPGTFDLRRFHDRLLAYGSVPVALAGAAMRKAHAVV